MSAVMIYECAYEISGRSTPLPNAA